jgi:hypothetical protein
VKVWPITAFHSFDRLGGPIRLLKSTRTAQRRPCVLCHFSLSSRLFAITGVVVASCDVCKSTVYTLVYCSILNRSPFALFPDSESVVDKSIPEFCLPYPTSCFVFCLPVTRPSAIQVDLIYFPTIHSQGWHRYSSTSVLGSIRSDSTISTLRMFWPCTDLY